MSRLLFTAALIAPLLLLPIVPITARADDHRPASPESPAGYNVPVRPPPVGPPESQPRVDDLPFAADGHPLAGYHNGLFYIRDHHDNFHLYIQGRSQIDFYGSLGPGVPQTTLKPTLFVRRIRPEITGELLGHWRFMMAGDFGATAIDNPKATTETAASAPGTAPTATSARFAGAETTRFQAAATDVYINYRQGAVFNIQVGQMDAPFMMENRTSDKYLPFMERSLAVRAVGIPSNKEIGAMVWGETHDRHFYYSVGPWNGDGQNRPNIDARFDVMGRVVVHPFATAKLPDVTLRDIQIGFSGHYGSRDKKWVDYDYPVMTTQGAYAFWSPVYTSSKGPTHIMPSGDQRGFAGEARIPFRQFDLTGELVYIDNDTREGVEGFQASNSERFGSLSGISYYATLGFWVLGTRDINGVPGYGNPPRLDYSQSDPREPPQALQLLLKWEQVALDYESASRAGTPDAKNIDGKIRVNAVTIGGNYWATRHVRISLDYVHDVFPSSGPVSDGKDGPVQSSHNRAQAPGNGLSRGVDDNARTGAHDLHEVLARAAIAL